MSWISSPAIWITCEIPRTGGRGHMRSTRWRAMPSTTAMTGDIAATSGSRFTEKRGLARLPLRM